MSERGSYKPGVYTKVESFVGRQSLVAHLTDQQIVPIKITRLSPASQAVHEEIANALKEGQVLTKRDLLEMYERCGVPLSSISRLRFEVTSGRFLKRIRVSISRSVITYSTKFFLVFFLFPRRIKVFLLQEVVLRIPAILDVFPLRNSYISKKQKLGENIGKDTTEK